MKIRDLLIALPNEMSDSDAWVVDDPLTQPVALLETQFLGICVDSLRSRVGVILELRQALQPYPVNTAVLIGDGVSSVQWAAQRAAQDLLAHPIVDWELREGANSLTGRAALASGASFTIATETFLFVLGSVPGLDGTVSDYSEHDALSIQGQVADWDSEFSVFGASRRSSRGVNG